MRDDELPMVIKRLEDDMLGMKAAQPLAGDAWVVYRSVSSNTWDLNIGPSTPSNYDKNFKITFTPSGNNSVNTFAFISSYQDEYNTGLDATSFVAYDDPCAIYVKVKAGFGWSVSSVIKIKFIAFSPYSGSINVTAL